MRDILVEYHDHHVVGIVVDSLVFPIITFAIAIQFSSVCTLAHPLHFFLAQTDRHSWHCMKCDMPRRSHSCALLYLLFFCIFEICRDGGWLMLLFVHEFGCTYCTKCVSSTTFRFAFIENFTCFVRADKMENHGFAISIVVGSVCGDALHSAITKTYENDASQCWYESCLYRLATTQKCQTKTRL